MAAEQISQRFATCLILVLATAVAWSAPQRASVDQLLLRVFERPPKLSYTVVQDRSFGLQTGNKRRYKQFVDSNGTTISTLIDLKAGTVTVDDGKTTTDYDLARKTVFTNQSFRKNDYSGKERAGIAKKNYTFKVFRGEQISGRRTEKLLATPKNSALAVRTYWFDLDTKIMLRQVQELPSGESYTTLDTIEVNFTSPRPLVPAVTPSWTRISQSPSVFTKSAKTAAANAGFSFSVPSDLPAGFIVQGYVTQTFGADKLMSVVLNDGFYRPILHVHRRDWGVSTEGGSLGGGKQFEVGKFNAELVSDLPPTVVTAIIRAFTKANS
jgi:hypothetical protein